MLSIPPQRQLHSRGRISMCGYVGRQDDRRKTVEDPRSSRSRSIPRLRRSDGGGESAAAGDDELGGPPAAVPSRFRGVPQRPAWASRGPGQRLRSRPAVLPIHHESDEPPGDRARGTRRGRHPVLTFLGEPGGACLASGDRPSQAATRFGVAAHGLAIANGQKPTVCCDRQFRGAPSAQKGALDPQACSLSARCPFRNSFLSFD